MPRKQPSLGRGVVSTCISRYRLGGLERLRLAAGGEREKKAEKDVDGQKEMTLGWCLIVCCWNWDLNYCLMFVDLS